MQDCTIVDTKRRRGLLLLCDLDGSIPWRIAYSDALGRMMVPSASSMLLYIEVAMMIYIILSKDPLGSMCGVAPQ